ncbi:MAG: RNase adapter RapZ [Actinomycetales bacterium]|nr:RNase adapter RapZ [Actinomycetales bacterium]
MSGAGKSTAAHVLEDLGWYVVDNLPPQLIPELAALASSIEPAATRVGVVVDVRRGPFFAALSAAMDELSARGVGTRVLFLDAADDVLVRRFESVRRPHPLQGEGRILDGIQVERSMLGDLRASAQTVVDTSRFNTHQLAAAIVDAFGDDDAPELRVTLMSFGFKYGLPMDADNVVDVRFLPNPYWVPELRARTGLDRPVSSFVLGREGAAEFLDRYVAAMRPVLAGYVRENKRYVTIAVGCTGGKHRSVALAEELALRLREPGVRVSTVHRDLGRE